MKNTKKKNGAAAKGKGRAALSAQQTIPYLSMHPDGVCKLPGGLYTKTVEYEDINYSVASTEDQTAIFSGWSSFLNYFDSSLPFQLSFINRRSHSRSRYQVNIPKADDNYNSVPTLPSAPNILAATPGVPSMPAPTIDTFAILSS